MLEVEAVQQMEKQCLDYDDGRERRASALCGAGTRGEAVNFSGERCEFNMLL